MLNERRNQLVGALARIDVLRSVAASLFAPEELKALDDARDVAVELRPARLNDDEQTDRDGVIAMCELAHLLGYLLEKLLSAPAAGLGAVAALEADGARMARFRLTRDQKRLFETVPNTDTLSAIVTATEKAQGLAKSIGDDDKLGKAIGDDDKLGKQLTEEQQAEVVSRLAFQEARSRLVGGLAKRALETPA